MIIDYTKLSLLFRIRKAVRYVGLYGLRRTLVKIRGHYHQKRRYETLPRIQDSGDPRKHVGIIGCGNFAFSNIGHYLRKNYGAVIRGGMDHDIHHAASLAQEYAADYYTDDASRIMNDASIDLIYIASNHASHAEYAIEALGRGKAVHIEKPHVVRDEQLVRLCSAIERTTALVQLGFNRPNSEIGITIQQFLGNESGPAMLNWFIAGHELPADHWYFAAEEGGRVLGNLCHWTDFVLHLVAPEDRYPLRIRPTRAARSDCDIAVTYLFGDGTIAAITFSAKGHTFEGVRERFAAHRGNVLLTMDDFKTLTVDVVDRRYRRSLLFRDHGHEGAIRRSYEMVRPRRGVTSVGVGVDHVWETGNLFLRTKEALDENRDVIIERGFRTEDLRLAAL